MYGQLLQPHNFLVSPPNEVVLKCIYVECKGLPNGVNFILIELRVGVLLLINKVSSEHGRLYA